MIDYVMSRFLASEAYQGKCALCGVSAKSHLQVFGHSFISQKPGEVGKPLHGATGLPDKPSSSELLTSVPSWQKLSHPNRVDTPVVTRSTKPLAGVEVPLGRHGIISVNRGSVLPSAEEQKSARCFLCNATKRDHSEDKLGHYFKHPDTKWLVHDPAGRAVSPFLDTGEEAEKHLSDYLISPERMEKTLIQHGFTPSGMHVRTTTHIDPGISITNPLPYEKACDKCGLGEEGDITKRVKARIKPKYDPGTESQHTFKPKSTDPNVCGSINSGHICGHSIEHPRHFEDKYLTYPAHHEFSPGGRTNQCTTCNNVVSAHHQFVPDREDGKPVNRCIHCGEENLGTHLHAEPTMSPKCGICGNKAPEHHEFIKFPKGSVVTPKLQQQVIIGHGSGGMWHNPHHKLVVQLRDKGRWQLGKYLSNPHRHKLLYTGTNLDTLHSTLRQLKATEI